MNEFIMVATAHLLAVASPGPDFALIMKNALSGGKRVGLYTAAGIALGIGVHVFYSVVGLALVISKSIVLFNLIKLLGSAYLIWLGFKALRSKKIAPSSHEELPKDEAIRSLGACKQGFLTNVLNPKATLFFLSLFTQVISNDTSTIIKIAYGIEMSLMTFIWFSLVTLLMTRRVVRKQYERVKHHLDRTFGAILVALGIKVALSTK